jgi:hypothetical protein
VKVPISKAMSLIVICLAQWRVPLSRDHVIIILEIMQ